MKEFKFRVNNRKTGKIMKYVKVKGKDIDDACEILQDRLKISHSVRNSMRNPIVFYVKDPDGKYRCP